MGKGFQLRDITALVNVRPCEQCGTREHLEALYQNGAYVIECTCGAHVQHEDGIIHAIGEWNSLQFHVREDMRKTGRYHR